MKAKYYNNSAFEVLDADNADTLDGSDSSAFLSTTGSGSSVTAAFTVAGTKEDINTGETLATIFGKIKKWFASFGSAAWLTAGTSSGNVPTIGTALGTTDNAAVVTNTSGALKPHASGALGSAAFKTVGASSNNVPNIGTALGTTDNVPVVTNTSGALKPHASGALGSAAFVGAGSASGAATLDSDSKITPSQASIKDVEITASTNLGTAHNNRRLRCTNSSAITITVKTQANVTYIAEHETVIKSEGAGQVTIALESGVSVKAITPANLDITIGGSAVLHRSAENVWSLDGALEA